jgi:hypothetical protein
MTSNLDNRRQVVVDSEHGTEVFMQVFDGQDWVLDVGATAMGFNINTSSDPRSPSSISDQTPSSE